MTGHHWIVEVDRSRLEELFAAYAPAVRAYALRRTDPVSADDVVMDVFVVACRRLDAVPEQPLPWLLACARRVLANQRRTVRRSDALVIRVGSALGGTLVDPGASERLEQALSSLRESDREVLLLNAWEDLDGAALATVLGCSRTAAGVRLHRARRRLAAAYARADPATPRRDDPELEVAR
jgi:RNA polymerase sigma-70 factor, ECF subfamily